MKQLLYILLAITFTSCSTIKYSQLIGSYEEITGMPDVDHFYFHSDSTFIRILRSDGIGQYDKGKYKISQDNLHLHYDTIELNKPIVEITSNINLSPDSILVKLNLFGMGGADVIILNNDKVIGKFEGIDNLKKTLNKRDTENLKFEVSYFVGIDKKSRKFKINILKSSTYNIFYYPSNANCSFNNYQNEKYYLKHVKKKGVIITNKKSKRQYRNSEILQSEKKIFFIGNKLYEFD